MNSIHSRRSFALMAIALPFATPTEGFWSNDQDSKSDKKSTEKAKGNEKVYVPGGDVKAPKLTHYVEPEFSSSSKEAFVDGVVKIETVVTVEGLPSELKILTGLNAEEDKTAMEAVRQWRFRPGTKGDEPVKVRVTVEVDFHLL